MHMPAAQRPRWPAAIGALLAGVSVGLSAYASHAVDGIVRQHLLLAAAFAFGHGVALVALSARTQGRLGASASLLLMIGTLLFSGSLVAKSLLGWPSMLAPWGGTMLMLGWLLHVIGALRR